MCVRAYVGNIIFFQCAFAIFFHEAVDPEGSNENNHDDWIVGGIVAMNP